MTTKSASLTRLYNPAQVAEYAGVSRRTVYRWIESGYLPARKISLSDAWSVTESDLLLLLSGKLRGRKLSVSPEDVTDLGESSGTPSQPAVRGKNQNKRRR